eukprot:CAMPEP_0198133560 /NCGR_PEP_ID=MMETSP1442-20131203/59627_1 /TAXON_ID= /ORGANISM="Craspedostauros australis, Strain CCMP3328" /LENGTH=264 /DNA_ID=CAMNT_0043794683 /DNA_START=204 /DNA_END=998 /DNA_ORIENTATION=+
MARRSAIWSAAVGHATVHQIPSQTPAQASRGYQTRLNPSHLVFGDTSAFVVKAIAPEFKTYNSTMSLDYTKRGRLLLEWVPKLGDGKFNWKTPVRFALSADEAAEVVSRTAMQEKTEFFRKVSSSNGQYQNQSSGDFDGEQVEKVCTVEPSDDGCVEFKLDHQISDPAGPRRSIVIDPNAPISIRLMGGEYLVIKSIIEFSIPYLIGWAPAMEASLQANIDKAADESGGLGGDGFHDNYNRNSRSTNYHTRDSVLRGNNNDVPF